MRVVSLLSVAKATSCLKAKSTPRAACAPRARRENALRLEARAPFYDGMALPERPFQVRLDFDNLIKRVTVGRSNIHFK